MKRSDERKVTRGIASFLLVAVCLAGCSGVEVQVSGRGAGPVEQGEALTLVLDYGGGSPDDAVELEARLSTCVQEALEAAGSPAHLLPSAEFRRAVFPGMDITSAPRSVESLAALLKAPEFRQKIEALHLRYVVNVREGTASRHQPVFVGVGYPGGGILGAGYTKQTGLTAGIIDMRRANQAGVVTSTVGSAGFYG